VNDEHCIRMVNNNIHVYKERSFDPEKMHAIPVEGIEGASLFPKAPFMVATFVPEKKDIPASVNIFELLNPEKVIATKSFFRAKEAELHWCFDGSAVLAHTFDYGEHSLYIINRGLQAKIILDAGAINMIQWRQVFLCFRPPAVPHFDFFTLSPFLCSPTIRQFLIVYASARKFAVFNIDGAIVAAFEDGNYRKELVSYSPDGKYVSLCRIGFDQKLRFEIREVKTKAIIYALDTAKQLSFVEWAPNSNFFVIGSHSPLVAFDNGFNVLNLSGKR